MIRKHIIRKGPQASVTNGFDSVVNHEVATHPHGRNNGEKSAETQRWPKTPRRGQKDRMYHTKKRNERILGGHMTWNGQSALVHSGAPECRPICGIFLGREFELSPGRQSSLEAVFVALDKV